MYHLENVYALEQLKLCPLHQKLYTVIMIKKI